MQTRWSVFLVLLLVALSRGISAQEEILVSPGDDLQAIITAAPEGSVLLFESGEYSSNVLITKTLTLRGAGTDPSDCVFQTDVGTGIRELRCSSETCYMSDVAAITVAGGRAVNVYLENLRVICNGSFDWGLLCLEEATVTASECELERVLVTHSASVSISSSKLISPASTFGQNDRMHDYALSLQECASGIVKDSEIQCDQRSPHTGIRLEDDSTLHIEGELACVRCNTCFDIYDRSALAVDRTPILNGWQFSMLLHSQYATVDTEQSALIPIWYVVQLNAGSGPSSVDTQPGGINLALLGGYSNASLRERTVLHADLLDVARFPDEFPVLQQAVDAVRPGGIVFIAEGVHEQSATIDKRVMLLGEGEDSILKPSAFGPRIILSILASADDVEIIGVAIQDADIGIYTYGTNVDIQEVTLENCDVGIYGGGESSALVRESLLRFNGTSVAIEDEAAITISRCDLYESDQGISVSDFSQLTLAGSTLQSHSGDAVQVSDSAQLQIDDCRLNRNGGFGIGYSWGHANIMLNCAQSSFNENGKGGISPARCVDATITDCEISSNEGVGISLSTVGYVDLAGLQILDNQDVGLEINGYGSESDGFVSVWNSVIEGNGSHGIVVGDSPGWCYIEEVQCSGNSGDGIFVSSQASAEIRDSALAGNDGFGVFVESLESTVDDEHPTAFAGWVTGSGLTYGTGNDANKLGRYTPEWIQRLLTGDQPAPIVIQLNPTMSIEGAIEQAPPGSTLELASGIYDEQIRLQRSLTLIGKGELPEDTELSQRLSISGTSGTELRLSNVSLAGVAIRNYTGSTSTSMDNVHIDGTLFHKSESASSSLTIRESSIDASFKYYGIYTEGDAGAIRLENVTISEAQVAGVLVRGDTNLTLVDCRILHSGWGVVATSFPYIGSGSPMELQPYLGTIAGVNNWIPLGDQEDSNEKGVISPQSQSLLLPPGFLIGSSSEQ